MSKSIGIMTIWGREEFVEPAIKQAAELLVDELYVTIACMHPDLEVFRDLSEELARQLAGRYANVHYVDSAVDYRRPWYENMGFVLNQLLDAANPENGDFILLADVDEFYTEPALQEINEYIKAHPDFVSLRFRSKFVGPTWEHFVYHAHTRLHRWWPGRCFVPTSSMEPHIERPPVILQDHPMYHYSLFVPVDYKDTFWAVEFGLPTSELQNIKRLWWRLIYQNYDPADERTWMERNAAVTEHCGFWMERRCEEQGGGGLFYSQDPHPKYMEESGLKAKIGDPRAYFGRSERRAIGPALETLRQQHPLRGLWVHNVDEPDTGHVEAAKRELKPSELVVLSARPREGARGLDWLKSGEAGKFDFAYIDSGPGDLFDICCAVCPSLLPGALVAGSVFSRQDLGSVESVQQATAKVQEATRRANAYWQDLQADGCTDWWFFIPIAPASPFEPGCQSVAASFSRPLACAIRAVRRLVPAPFYFEWGQGLSERIALAEGLKPEQCMSIRDSTALPISKVNYRSEREAGVGYAVSNEIRQADIVFLSTACRRMACYREAVRKTIAGAVVLLHGAAQKVAEAFFFPDTRLVDPWTERDEEAKQHAGGTVLCVKDPNVRAFVSRYLPFYRGFRELAESAQFVDAAPKPTVSGAPTSGVQINFDDESIVRKRLVAGPWAGEFGYELMYWVPFLRTMSRKFTELVAIVPEGHEALYEDFAAEVMTHRIDLGENKWRTNAGDVLFWKGQWQQYAVDAKSEQEMNAIVERLHVTLHGAVILESNKSLFRLPPTHRRLAVEGVQRNPDLLLLHCRRAGLERDWPSEKFDALCQKLNVEGIVPWVVGLPGDYLPKAQCKDRRTVELKQTIRILSEAGLIAGASTGVQHLASLCCTPQVVWGTGGFSIPEYGTVQEAYERFWNPFNNWVQFLDVGFDPEVEVVFRAIVGALNVPERLTAGSAALAERQQPLGANKDAPLPPVRGERLL